MKSQTRKAFIFSRACRIAALFSVALTIVVCSTVTAVASVIHVPDQYPTIQEGTNAAVAGDTVMVAPGVYHENVRMTDRVTLLGSGAEFTTIDGGGNGHVVVFNQACGTIKGLTITNSGSDPGYSAGIFSSHCSIIVEDCIIANNNHGITLSSNSYGTIVRNRIVDGALFGAGIRLLSSSGAIVGNVIAGNRWGISCYRSSPAVISNTIVNNSSFGIVCNPVTSHVITSNIVSLNDFGIFALGGAESAVPLLNISYNDVWSNSQGDYWDEYGTIGPGGFVVSRPFDPIPGTGEISANPLFLDANSGNFRLAEPSPCIDAGTPDTVGIHIPLHDMEGNERILDGNGDGTAIIDMGAHEFRRVVMATLDIKPGSCPNPFNRKLFEFAAGSNPRKGGVLPVAVLGSETFDVAEIDVSTLRLEGVGPLMSGGGPKLEYVAAALDKDSDCECTEDGSDRFIDLKMKFLGQEIAAAVPMGARGEERVLTLTGELLDGTPFEATDCVVFVGPPGERAVPANQEPTLNTAFPNPFNPVTRISYSIPKRQHVRLVVYDVAGRLVEELVNEVRGAGEYAVEWDAGRFPSGIYFYRLTVGSTTFTKKMVLLK